MPRRYFASVLALALVLIGAWAVAQNVIIKRVTSTVLAGDDVVFRLEGLLGECTPVGKIVVRVNGRHYEAPVARGS